MERSVGTRLRHSIRIATRAAVTLSVAAGSSDALGEPSPLVLRWTAPAGCPAEATVRERVSTLIGASVDSLPRGPFVAAGVVTTDGGAVRLHLETAVPGETPPGGGEAEVVRGARDLTGTSCEEVTAAGALVIALAIDPKAVEEQARRGPVASFAAPSATEPVAPPSAPVPAPTTSAAPATPPAPPPGSTRPEISASRRTEGLVAARLVGELGALPGASLGAGLGAGFSVNRFIVRVEGAFFFPRFAEAATPAADGRARGANVSLVAFDVGGCFVALPGEVELDVCAAVEPGALLAVGSHFDRTTSAVATWLAAGGSGELAWNLAPPLSVRAAVGAVFPFGRSRIQFTEITGNTDTSVNLTRPAPVSGRASLGAGLSF
ncbi:MAG TPA: hypothetical protein VHE30_26775 [Polyangiaceae bacterium]|nr:hypothetical protein [Polyangiaceae bacterium]